ncbi:MAG: hypothetical protein OXI40_17640 [Chloroflexota bacterium]|nr:hypothetical protein [Chloroflexota bacterium]
MNDKKQNTTESQNSDQTGNQHQEGQNMQEARDRMDTLPDKLENEDVFRAIKSHPPFRIRRQVTTNRK